MTLLMPCLILYMTVQHGVVSGQQSCVPIPPGTTSLGYTMTGDVNLGLIAFGRDFGTPDQPCLYSVSHASLVQVKPSSIP